MVKNINEDWDVLLGEEWAGGQIALAVMRVAPQVTSVDYVDQEISSLRRGSGSPDLFSELAYTVSRNLDRRDKNYAIILFCCAIARMSDWSAQCRAPDYTEEISIALLYLQSISAMRIGNHAAANRICSVYLRSMHAENLLVDCYAMIKLITIFTGPVRDSIGVDEAELMRISNDLDGWRSRYCMDVDNLDKFNTLYSGISAAC